MITSEQVERGQAAYSSTVLRNYDWMVLGLSNRLLWRCPTAELRRLYDRNVSDRHLDVGVGTGYFLDKATWPVGNPAITLVDPQPKLPGSDLRAHPQVLAADHSGKYHRAPAASRAVSVGGSLRPPPLCSGDDLGKRPSPSTTSPHSWHRALACLEPPSCSAICDARRSPRR